MTKEEKISFILDAVANKRISANMVDPASHGSLVTKLRKGTYLIGDDKLEDMYHNVIVHQKDTPIVTPNKEVKDTLKHQIVTPNINNVEAIVTPITPKVTPKERDVTPSLEARIWALEIENAELKLGIEGLKRKIEEFEKVKVTPKRTPKKETPKVMDWAIHFGSKKSSGYTYLKWYASKRINGRLVNIYLGASPDQAEEKIKAYLERHLGI